MRMDKNIREYPHPYKNRIRLGVRDNVKVCCPDSGVFSHCFRKMFLWLLPNIRHRILPPLCLQHVNLSWKVQSSTYPGSKLYIPWRSNSCLESFIILITDALSLGFGAIWKRKQQLRGYTFSRRIAQFTKIRSMLKALYKTSYKQTTTNLVSPDV